MNNNHNKFVKKFLKWFAIIFFLVLFLTLACLGIYVFSAYKKASAIEIDDEKLLAPTYQIAIYDNENKPINDYNEINKSYAKINTLSENTKNAFISIEDKNFYKHNGVNYKRIAKAMINNIKSKKFKEGASTITQQLVKNTQLTSEKTFDRKIKEIALAKKLEAKYTKDQILEMYLNIIYFGNNCYGIENAANYYFSCKAKDLSLPQACTLAGMIKSPSYYSPIKNYNNALKRRNLVLSEMKKDGFITENEYFLAKNKEIELIINTEKKNKLNSYSQSAIEEAEKILNKSAQAIAVEGYKIYTYQDEEKQKALAGAFANQSLQSDSAGIVVENNTKHICAYIGNSNYKILDAKRQPGSAIKPILVFAPALNEDIVYPCTQLLDEKTTIVDYNPKNVGNIYHGYVSARDALSKSINIPAIKVLSYVGIDKAKAYASSLGIEFDKNDDSYALALGGMRYGTNVIDLAGAYSTFASEGYYKKPTFVSFITDKNSKIVYIDNTEKQKVLREDCCYLLTDMLRTCANDGTAKKLSSLNSEIASKTGTVGKPNSKQNLDAWNVSYTPNYTCAVWLGNLDNTPIDYAGGNQPTQIVKDYFSQMPDKSHFVKPDSITERNIDIKELEENHRIVLANEYMPERYTKTEMFSKFNLPNDVSTKFTSIDKPNVKSKVENNNAIIELDAKDYLTYCFLIDDKEVKQVSCKSGVQTIILPIKENQTNVKLNVYYTLCPEINTQETIKLIKTNSTKKSNEKWFI